MTVLRNFRFTERKCTAGMKESNSTYILCYLTRCRSLYELHGCQATVVIDLCAIRLILLATHLVRN
jgi:hypothetical protein